MPDSVLITGLVLGVLQLIAGLALGYWIAKPRVAAKLDEDRKQAQRLANELRTLTAGLSIQAREQGQMLQSVDNRLRSEVENAEAAIAEHPITSLVVGVVREMATANQLLQKKLATAELEIEAQSSEIAEHMQQAMTDPLTSLPNRRALDDHLRMRMDAWRKHQTPFSLAMVDVDHFKQFNDTHGHTAGDLALKAVGQALRSALRQHDVVARFGGEEFALLLPHTTLETALPAVHKAITAIREAEVRFEGIQGTVTASAGVASIISPERSSCLLQRADLALYAAKESGRDQAWAHDGAQCLPLENVALLGENAEIDEQLATVCGDLRDSMSDFMGE